MVGATPKVEAEATVEAPPADVATEDIAYPELVIKTLTVDPDIAREWLDKAAPNRNISRVNLEGIMQAMLEDRWHNDGTPIRFNSQGQLIDGQHRLHAVINTGQSYEFVVMWGVRDEAMVTLDTGKSRSRGDVLMIHDPTLVNVQQVASAATIILRWSKGVRNNNLRNEYVSNDEVIRFYDANRDDIVEATRHGGRMAKHIAAGSGQAYALTYWLFVNIDASDAEFFWDRLHDGAGLEPGSAIYALRELLRREAALPSTRDKMRADIMVALMIKAWNAYRRGEEVKLLHFKMGGAHPERFPEPV